MFAWMQNNLPTIITGAVLLLIVAAAVFALVRDRKKGKRSCGCNCSACAMSGMCHGKK